MPKLSKNEASDSVQLDGYEGHFGQLGDYTVGVRDLHRRRRPRRTLPRLPDDRCQCPHWGVVLKGKLKFTSDDGETIIGAGEAYYVGPGHLPQLYAGTEVIEFSPTHELHETLAVVERNMAAQAG